MTYSIDSERRGEEKIIQKPFFPAIKGSSKRARNMRIVENGKLSSANRYKTTTADEEQEMNV